APTTTASYFISWTPPPAARLKRSSTWRRVRNHCLPIFAGNAGNFGRIGLDFGIAVELEDFPADCIVGHLFVNGHQVAVKVGRHFIQSCSVNAHCPGDFLEDLLEVAEGQAKIRGLRVAEVSNTGGVSLGLEDHPSRHAAAALAHQPEVVLKDGLAALRIFA